MKLFSYLIIACLLILPSFVFAETCPCCGQDIEAVQAPTVQIEKDAKGRMVTWTETQASGLKREDKYTYYPTSEVDTITESVYGSGNKLIERKVVKHYTDGKQPTVGKEVGK